MTGDAPSRALMICPEAPYPLTGGGAQRSACVLEYLVSRYAVDLVLFRQPHEPEPIPPLRELAQELLVLELPFHSRHWAAKAARNARRWFQGIPPLNDRFRGFGREIARFVHGKRYRAGVIEHFWCAPYWKEIAPACERTVLDLHNVESVLLDRIATIQPWPASSMLRRFASAARSMERRWLPVFDVVLTASSDDAAAVEHITSGAKTHVYPNTLRKSPAPVLPEENVIVFSGNFEYLPNADAVLYFARRIWPLISSRCPGVKWRLVGRNAAKLGTNLGQDPRIEFVGPVEDAVRELTRANVVIVPLRAGSGTRVKILEAWAAARPVVSTTAGAEGLDATPGTHLLIADAPADFASAVCGLLADADLRRRMGEAGRRRFEERYSREAGFRSLSAAGI